MPVVEIQARKSDVERLQMTRNALRLISEGKNEDNARILLQKMEAENRRRLGKLPKRVAPYGEDWPDEGIMKSYGYRVGHGGASSDYRRAVLDYVMTCDHLMPVWSTQYMREWGYPQSLKRYRKLHAFLQKNEASRSDKPQYAKACREWREDVDYIEETWAKLVTNPKCHR